MGAVSASVGGGVGDVTDAARAERVDGRVGYAEQLGDFADGERAIAITWEPRDREKNRSKLFRDRLFASHGSKSNRRTPRRSQLPNRGKMARTNMPRSRCDEPRSVYAARGDSNVACASSSAVHLETAAVLSWGRAHEPAKARAEGRRRLVANRQRDIGDS